MKKLLFLLIPLAMIACNGSVSTGTDQGGGFIAKAVLMPSGNTGLVLDNKDTMEIRSSKKDTSIQVTASYSYSITKTDTIRHKYIALIPVDTTTQPVTGTRSNLILDANFDGSDPFTGFTRANGQYCCSYSITQVSSPDGLPGKSLKYDLRSTDAIVSSSKRAEIQLAGTDAPQESERWYGLRYWLEKYDADNGAESIIQWHDVDNTTPPLSIQVAGGRFNITQSFASGNLHYDGGPTVTGKWINIVMHVKWSITAGILEVWINGTRMVSKVNVRTNSNGGSYLKLGINKWSWAPGGGSSTATQRIFYIDNFRMGSERSTYADVAP